MSAKPSLWLRLGWRGEALLWDMVMGLFARLPIETASALGGRALRLIGPLFSAHRAALINARLVFPDISDQDAHVLAMAAWDNLGRIGGEFAHLKELRPYTQNGRVEVIGLEHLEAIKKSGKPAVLISGHFANWEVMAAAICLGGIEARVSYRHANNPHIDKRITKARLDYGIPHLSAKGEGGAREMLVAMKNGQSTTFLNDQKFNMGIDAPFFGHLLKTAPGPARLAIRFGVPIVPVSITRRPNARFTVTFHPSITPSDDPDKTKAIAQTVTMINQFIEERVRENPQDWFWVHRRWPKEIYRKSAGSKPSAD